MKYFPVKSDRRYMIEVIDGRYVLTFAGAKIADTMTLGQAWVRATTHRINAPPVVEQRA